MFVFHDIVLVVNERRYTKGFDGKQCCWMPMPYEHFQMWKEYHSDNIRVAFPDVAIHFDKTWMQQVKSFDFHRELPKRDPARGLYFDMLALLFLRTNDFTIEIQVCKKQKPDADLKCNGAINYLQYVLDRERKRIAKSKMRDTASPMTVSPRCTSATNDYDFLRDLERTLLYGIHI